jgi:solute:Na+ symporter, SSS family
MTYLDYAVMLIYVLILGAITLYHFRKNKSAEEFYVGGRNMNPTHVGFSVAATDVGGGFSIGLGGLGFAMGLSASWLLFTGLIGALLAAVWLIPRLKYWETGQKFLSYADLLRLRFGNRTATLAAIVSLLGYIGFTSSQFLAGAKLASAGFPEVSLTTALLVMAAFAIVYTAVGGLGAVVATDSFQWVVLLGSLSFVAFPFFLRELGGLQGVMNTLEPSYFSLTQLKWSTAVNWFVTIVPIWFVAMTLYQRIFALNTKAEAQRAWYVAGFFEWPCMAFVGTLLGVLARAAFLQGHFADLGFPIDFEGFDSEQGVPLLMRSLLPSGLMGLLLIAYFSAILSTADSCLMAASGNFVGDVLNTQKMSHQKLLRFSQLATLGIGILALGIALLSENVLSLMLHSYSFMVAGLLVPTIFALSKRYEIKKFVQTRSHQSDNAAVLSILVGGFSTVFLGQQKFFTMPWGLDPVCFGLLLSLLAYLLASPKIVLRPQT